ncbi:hypothetical protein [Terriglobus roseus]|nr:hypothetical protein [Terriglobus roseus]
MNSWKRPVAALSLVVCLATGCTKQQSAIDAAKKDVVATGQPEEVVYVDGAGNTTLTMVNAPAPGTTQPTMVQTTAPAGTQTVGLPDWSNGQHPQPRHAARYRSPGVILQAAEPAEPGTAMDPNARPYSAAVAPGADNATNGAYAPPANFVPTDVTIPAGTGLAIRINQRIDVKHTAPGERFTGVLAESVSRDGKVILPRGTNVRGVVDAAHRRGHFKGRSILELRLTSIVFNGKTYPLETADFVASKKGKGKRTAGFIGGTAGLGMLVGGLATGGVGLAVGGLAGGGLGTLLAGTTGNRDIVIPAESLVRFRLEDSLTVQPADNGAAQVAER